MISMGNHCVHIPYSFMRRAAIGFYVEPGMKPAQVPMPGRRCSLESMKYLCCRLYKKRFVHSIPPARICFPHEQVFRYKIQKDHYPSSHPRQITHCNYKNIEGRSRRAHTIMENRQDGAALRLERSSARQSIKILCHSCYDNKPGKPHMPAHRATCL